MALGHPVHVFGSVGQNDVPGLYFRHLGVGARVVEVVVVPVAGLQVFAVGRQRDGGHAVEEVGVVQRQAALLVGTDEASHVGVFLVFHKLAFQGRRSLVVGCGEQLDDYFVIGFRLHAQAHGYRLHLREAVFAALFDLLGLAVDKYFQAGGRRNVQRALHEPFGTQMGGEKVKQAVALIGLGQGDVACRVGLQALAVGAVEVEADAGLQQIGFGEFFAGKVDAVSLQRHADTDGRACVVCRYPLLGLEGGGGRKQSSY